MQFILKIITALKVLFFIKDDLEKLKKDMEALFEKAKKAELKAEDKAYAADADPKVSQADTDKAFDKLAKVTTAATAIEQAIRVLK